MSISATINNREQCQRVAAWLPVVCVSALMPTILFPVFSVQRIVLICLGIAWLADYILNRRWQGWQFTPDKWMYVLMIVFFLLTPLHQLFDVPATAYFHQQVERRLPFLAVGCLGLLGFSDKLRVRYVGYSMLLSGIAALITILVAQYITGHLHGTDFRYWFNMTRHTVVASHMEFNLFLNIAVIMGFHILQSPVRRALKIAVGIAMCICFMLVLFSDGRVGMITGLMIVLVLGIRQPIVRRHAWATGLFVLLLGAGALWHIGRNPRFAWDYVSHEPRLIVWRYSLEQMQKHPWTGYGLSSLSTEYVQHAYEHPDMNQYYIGGLLQLPEFADRPRDMYLIHPHNTFLETALEHGILGLLVLCALVVAVASVRMTPENRWYYGLTQLAILLQAMFEPLGKYFPPLLICIVIMVWHYGTRETEPPVQIND